MPPDQSSEQEADDPDSEFVEVDPSGRYGRYKEVLGRGAFKKVYRGFDKLEGIEIAWNQVKVADLLRNSVDMERLYSEVHLLKTLKHKNIIKFYNSWVETRNENINFITEIFTSGTLRQYRKKHKHVDVRALKKWSKQILEGLLYLHSHDPPVIHRDLKCDNIFVNGNQGEVKIGDLGLAAILHRRSAHSVIGTPEFMAPELYEEEYNELVDIYAFGMCLLELVTFDYPYVECSNAAQIYRKVTSGVRPASLEKVKDSRVKAFIEKCLVKVSERSSAKDLLMDPFLQAENDHGSIGHTIHPHNHSEGIIGRDFKVQGQRKDVNTIFLKLRIADSSGHCRNIHFPFDIEEDTAIAVASEMVEELDLTDQDVTAIAAMIDSEIQTLIPGWSSNEINGDEFDEDTPTHANDVSEIRDVASPFSNESDSSTSSFRLEKLPSGRMYWSDFPKIVVGSSPSAHSDSNMASQSDMIYKCDNITRNHPTSPGKGLDQCIRGDGNVEKNAVFLTKTHSRDDNSNRDTKAMNIGQISKDNLRGGSDYMDTIMKRLEELLLLQENEVKELRRKHESEVSDLMKEFYPETRRRILNMCKLKLSFGNEQ